MTHLSSKLQINYEARDQLQTFFVHTHSLPKGIDRDVLLGAVIVIENEPERFARYYDCNIQDHSVGGFLKEWSSLRARLNLRKDAKTLLALEGTGGRHDLTKNLALYHQLGLRIIQPYHWMNAPFFDKGGLTPIGRDLFRQMEMLDMILDVSHMPSKILSQTLDIFTGRLIASHVVLADILYSQSQRSNCLSSSEIRALARRSALFGVPFVNDLVSPEGTDENGNCRADIDDVVSQIKGIVDIAGVKNVALGPDLFDFTGFKHKLHIRLEAPDDLDATKGLIALKGQLAQAGFSSQHLAGVMYQNALRFFAKDFGDDQVMSEKDDAGSHSSSANERMSSWTFQTPKNPQIYKAANNSIIRAPGPPTHAWISLSNYCNFSCLHCKRHYRTLKAADNNRDISDLLWERIKDEVLPGLNSLILGGNNHSEITLANRFPDMVRYLSTLGNRPSSLSIQTNGSRINQDLLADLVELDFVFNISIEGGTNITTSHIRKMSLNTISKRIQDINCLRSSGRSKSRIVLSFTAMMSYLDELPLLLEFAERQGVDEVNVMFLLPATKQWNAESPVHDITQTNRVIEQTYQLSKYWRVQLLAPVIKEVRENHPCIRPWHSVSVNGNGDIRFCCLEDAPQLGNLQQSSFWDIWQGKSAAISRSTINGPKPPGECSACVLRNFPVVSVQALRRQLAH